VHISSQYLEIERIRAEIQSLSSGVPRRSYLPLMFHARVIPKNVKNGE